MTPLPKSFWSPTTLPSSTSLVSFSLSGCFVPHLDLTKVHRRQVFPVHPSRCSCEGSTGLGKGDGLPPRRREPMTRPEATPLPRDATRGGAGSTATRPLVAALLHCALRCDDRQRPRSLVKATLGLDGAAPSPLAACAHPRRVGSVTCLPVRVLLVDSEPRHNVMHYGSPAGRT